MNFLRKIVLGLLSIASLAHADVVSVDGFQALPQEMSNWCWAASIQSVFLTKGLQVDQKRIVTSAYGSPVNSTAPGFGGTLKLLNGLTIANDGSYWLVKASAANSYPNANWLFGKLQGGEPVIIWYKDEYSNHSIILRGGQYFRDGQGNIHWQQLYAFDPFLNRDMLIDASNIPKYVYGSFDIDLEKFASNPKQVSMDDEPSLPRDDYQPKTTPHSYKVPDWMK